MSAAPTLMQAPVTEDAPDGARAVELLGARLRVRLRAGGVLLPDAALDRLAEDVLEDAIHVALGWLER